MNPLDQCLMNKTVDAKQITILIHVDDLLVLAKTVELLHLVRDILLEEFEKIEWKLPMSLHILECCYRR